jgi:hypothetical protein
VQLGLKKDLKVFQMLCVAKNILTGMEKSAFVSTDILKGTL